MSASPQFDELSKLGPFESGPDHMTIHQRFPHLQIRGLREHIYSLYCIAESAVVPFFQVESTGTHGAASAKKPLFPHEAHILQDAQKALIRSTLNNRHQSDIKTRYAEFIFETGISRGVRSSPVAVKFDGACRLGVACRCDTG